MKRIYILLFMVVSVCSLSAQTEKAKSMYEEVVSGKITKEKFLKQEELNWISRPMRSVSTER